MNTALEVVRGKVSLKLASLLGEVPEKKIRRDLSEARLRRRGARTGFTLHETFYFSLSEHGPLGALPRDRKRDLWNAITGRRRASGSVRLVGTTVLIEGAAPTRVDGRLLAEAIARRYVAWRRGQRRVTRDDATIGGALRFKGTRISVEHVGMLVNRGVSLPELLEDFPALSTDDLIFAGMYVRRGPRPGRPKKRLRFKRVA